MCLVYVCVWSPGAHSTQPVADCQDSVYGSNLDGRPCTADDDCWGYRCDRRRGACIMPMVEKHRKFIECIIEHSDVQVMRILYEKCAARHVGMQAHT